MKETCGIDDYHGAQSFFIGCMLYIGCLQVIHSCSIWLPQMLPCLNLQNASCNDNLVVALMLGF